MKVRHLLVLCLGLALMAAPIVAMAGVTASVHDLPDFYNYLDAQAKQGACSFCHVPHKAQAGGDRLFPVAYAAGLPATWSSDSLSNICWYCHGSASGYATAVEVNPFQAGSHARDTTKLTTRINPSSTDPADIAALPTDLNLVSGSLRCVSCHKIHDNTVKPFLQWGTSGNFSAIAGTGFCGKCHPNRSNTNTYGTGSTNHPSNTTFADNTTGDSPMTGAALPPRMQINMRLTSAIEGAWDLGGHAVWTNPTTEANTMVCGTCHAVHNNETTDWSAADGGTPVGTAVTSAGTPILVDKGTATLTTEQSAPICIDCHSTVFGIGVRGPGAATTFSHPVGTGSATADLMFAAGRGYKWNATATNRMIVCQSCHDIHWSGTNATARGTNNFLLAEQCNGCHSVAGTTLADHHPSNIANANALLANDTFAETPAAGGTDWVAKTQVNDGINYWAVSTTMTCDTCHFGGAGTAHNNVGGFPGLVGRNTESDMCVDCHGFNPSTSTTTQTGAAWEATHYVGGITTASYKKATAFAGTGAQAVYSPDGGANGAVICESCHTVAIVGKAGSPSGHTNSDITAYQISLNTGDGVAVTKDTVKLMLQNSGNMRGGFVSADNLCTACHGNTPGGGVTHPVLPVYTTNSTMVPGGNATTHLGKAVGQINCESCHRAHDADTDSSNWILEAAAILGTQIDYSSLCGLCHTGQF